MERNDTAGRDRDFLTRLRVASGALGLVAQLEVAETGKLHGAAMLQAGANLVEKHIDKQLRFERPIRSNRISTRSAFVIVVPTVGEKSFSSIAISKVT